MEQNQLAYRQFHSTDTTLIKVRDDILKVIESQQSNVLGSVGFIHSF